MLNFNFNNDYNYGFEHDFLQSVQNNPLDDSPDPFMKAYARTEYPSMDLEFKNSTPMQSSQFNFDCTVVSTKFDQKQEYDTSSQKQGAHLAPQVHEFKIEHVPI